MNLVPSPIKCTYQVGGISKPDSFVYVKRLPTFERISHPLKKHIWHQDDISYFGVLKF